jgi:hypothetical protein
MELLVFVVALCVLSVLALRFGHDSRPAISSKEAGFAALGYTWSSRPTNRPRRLGRRLSTHPVRHQLASGLYRVANWLYPVEPVSSSVSR